VVAGDGDAGRVSETWRRRAGAAYDVVWPVAAATTAGVGALAALQLPLHAVIAIWFGCTGILFVARLMEAEPTVVDSLRGVASLLWFGTKWGTVVAAGVALCWVGGTGALVAVIGLVLTAPSTLRLLATRIGDQHPVRQGAGRWAGRAPSATVGLRAADVEAADLEVDDHVTDDDMCRAWRSSYTALSRTSDPAARLRAVEVRALILDELERRDHAGLSAWMDSGARPGSDPGPHLSRPAA
jgi:hypothetical protein